MGQAEAERSGPVGIADGAGCRGTAAAATAVASEDWDGKARKGRGRWQTSEAGFSTGLDMFWHCGKTRGRQEDGCIS